MEDSTLLGEFYIAYHLQALNWLEHAKITIHLNMWCYLSYGKF